MELTLPIQNQIHEVEDDLLAAIDYCYEQGWTDGLPVVPPEESRVAAMCAMEGRPNETVIAHHPATGLSLTVHSLAVNAVMAGCLLTTSRFSLLLSKPWKRSGLTSTAAQPAQEVPRR